MRIHHVVFSVADIGKTIEWYRKTGSGTVYFDLIELVV